MPTPDWLFRSLLVLTTLANISQASTATFKGVDIPVIGSSGGTQAQVTPSTSVSNSISYSEAGIKSDSDGSETTYVRDIAASLLIDPDGNVTTLPTPLSAEATLVQSSNGFWISQVYTTTITVTPSKSESTLPPITNTIGEYQSCSLQSDGTRYACIWAALQTTMSYTTTAFDIVETNVGELKKDNNAVKEGTVMEIWRVMVVLSAMVVGAVVVL